MKKKVNCDFSGYATKNDLKCADGRTIRKDAFKECDGLTVPLVWQHQHNTPDNVLGHALLENRDDGVYSYCSFNDTPSGQNARTVVQHGDVAFLSIYANELVEKAKNVVHGVIREVSLVMAGANPGAKIDYLAFQHSDGSIDLSEEEAIIYTGLNIETEEVEHAADPVGDKTIGDVFNSLTEEQKTAVYAIVGSLIEGEEDDEVAQSAIKEDEGDVMKTNVFDGSAAEKGPSLTHDQFTAIIQSAQKSGSLKNAFLEHTVTYGIENIDFLFPDARTLTDEPSLISRDMTWVSSVINGTRHSPFSRIKTVHADITGDDARALGYVKGALKKEEFFTLLRRTTTPQTVYKKQKLDRDDIIDITDLDVVAWMKREMRWMLDEELARAVLVSDGRDPASEDKIIETNIRPIWKDADLYAHKVQLESTVDDPEEVIDAIIAARVNYKGSGSPSLYMPESLLTSMLLIKDLNERRIYANKAELESVLRVKEIVEVPVMEDLSRTVDQTEYELLAIMVNLKDYTMGADKGGQVSMFDDFDIDYNQFKYLIETRVSGALTLPKSALVIEREVPGN